MHMLFLRRLPNLYAIFKTITKHQYITFKLLPNMCTLLLMAVA